MKRIEKQYYEAPLSRIYGVVQQGILCASGDAEGYHNGNELDDNDFTTS
ncbi:MAG: hypothetical protein IK041_05895 [Bacteroidales bacterium]|nr:hypothetical protein [Bacteroidales bacterium]